MEAILERIRSEGGLRASDIEDDEARTQQLVELETRQNGAGTPFQLWRPDDRRSGSSSSASTI